MNTDDDEGRNATRVFATITRKSPHWHSALSATEDFLSTALKQLEDSDMMHVPGEEYKSSARLLVKRIWPHTIQLVFDVFNTSYDATLAHLQEYNALPVITIYFGRGEARKALANAGVRQKVNIETANAHNLNGERSVPPFIEDHTCGSPPMYLMPRNPSML